MFTELKVLLSRNLRSQRQHLQKRDQFHLVQQKVARRRNVKGTRNQRLTGKKARYKQVEKVIVRFVETKKGLVQKQQHLNIGRKEKLMKMIRQAVKKRRKKKRYLNQRERRIWFTKIQWTSRRKESSNPSGKNTDMVIGEKALGKHMLLWKL